MQKWLVRPLRLSEHLSDTPEPSGDHASGNKTEFLVSYCAFALRQK